MTSTDAKEKVTAGKQGDTWSVTVNGFYHYQIPEAVIVGGWPTIRTVLAQRNHEAAPQMSSRLRGCMHSR
jgi:hypothetical protein